MIAPTFIIGTSGYSFADWVGPFYPPGTSGREMFAHYVRAFQAVELNFTFYRMPSARTLEGLARSSPAGFQFWVKANQLFTHYRDLSSVPEFVHNLYPLADADKLAGVLLQFPQSFHRTIANRKHLAGTLEAMQSLPLAVEFRHGSWDFPATVEHLRRRGVALVVPDVPELPDLYRPRATATSDAGYLRLHSRTAGKWYAAGSERYDYNYSDTELAGLRDQWSNLDPPPERVFAFFNNCHRGQAAQNAQAFRRIVGQL